jgi:hypothetical protein
MAHFLSRLFPHSPTPAGGGGGGRQLFSDFWKMSRNNDSSSSSNVAAASSSSAGIVKGSSVLVRCRTITPFSDFYCQILFLRHCLSFWHLSMMMVCSGSSFL